MGATTVYFIKKYIEVVSLCYIYFLFQIYTTLSEKYQKVRSPVPRNKDHFDAGAKFHVPSDYQYVAYFVAHILQFQFHKSLCIAAGQYEPNNPVKPLHKCDIEGSQIAGQRLRDGLSIGLSKHWSDSLSVITNGEREISADAILEYFKPLQDFLIKENNKSRESKFLNCYKSNILHIFSNFVCIFFYSIGREAAGGRIKQSSARCWLFRLIGIGGRSYFVRNLLVKSTIVFFF